MPSKQKRKVRASEARRKPIGISIHIGLNDLSSHYNPRPRRLASCENDAAAMEELAKKRGFSTTLIKTKQASTRNVTAAIGDAAANLRRGDIMLLTYSGHGGQLPDGNGEEQDEEDGQDETWCLYDRELVDDELYALWGKFEEGVRILQISDSCHSGSVMKAVRRKALLEVPAVAAKLAERESKALPPDIAWKTYKAHQAMYDGIQKDNPQGDRVAVGASVILISACQDEQEAWSGYPLSLFTEKLLEVWNGGKYRGGHPNFRNAIAKLITLEDEQYPNYNTTGVPNPIFVRQPPFTIR